ncbi:MAG: type I DNA topoisomerase [Flavobacteriia bacterium]|nr:type I DNA topoisomerase [Flavobacteriia bacterium]
MSKNLVIVESPAKAKTIESYLGSDFIVKSSFGHVRDLSKRGLSIEIENAFQPVYEVSEDKKQIVNELKKLAKAAEMVWLATDEDREGEAISWHLFEALNLKDETTKRITFNEITKGAVLKAIENPRKINIGLVDAQQARRILDRIVGFELSPVLWRKVKPSLSAGRVQSVAVRLIVEKELEISKFESESFFKVVGQFSATNGNFKAELSKQLADENEANTFVSGLNASTFQVSSVEKKPFTRSPSAPFTTSTLQQEASLKLGFSVSRTMSVAQKLYEGGHITYMRTDSTNLSETALAQAEAEITSRFGAEYSKPTKYATKSASAQEAHEAIRPTEFSVEMVSEEREEQRLYDLIRKRTLASQMAKANLERTIITLAGAPQGLDFVSKGEVILFDGFLKAYSVTNMDEEDETFELLPKVAAGEAIALKEAKATQRFTRGPARYTEASLVKKMEELGIGRPSTYAPTISTIQKRNYVMKKESEGKERAYAQIQWTPENTTVTTLTETVGTDKNRLIPTDIGIVVTNFLVEHFAAIMDYQFTAQVEESFDKIANKNLVWSDMLGTFYKPFHANVEETLENSGRATGERALGEDPKSGRKVIARMGRYGAMIQIGDEQVDGEKPLFASLMKDQSITNITLEEAMDLFKMPRVFGEFSGEMLRVNIGKFGPYVQLGKTFASIPKDEDPMEITLERAIEIVEEKKKSDAEKVIKSFPEQADVFLLNGRYGAYLKIGKENYKLPKTSVPADLTFEECIEISKNQPVSKSKKSPKRKK